MQTASPQVRAPIASAPAADTQVSWGASQPSSIHMVAVLAGLGDVLEQQLSSANTSHPTLHGDIVGDVGTEAGPLLRVTQVGPLLIDLGGHSPAEREPWAGSTSILPSKAGHHGVAIRHTTVGSGTGPQAEWSPRRKVDGVQSPRYGAPASLQLARAEPQTWAGMGVSGLAQATCPPTPLPSGPGNQKETHFFALHSCQGELKNWWLVIVPWDGWMDGQPLHRAQEGQLGLRAASCVPDTSHS